jgi:spermidine/putrescine-binding protein
MGDRGTATMRIVAGRLGIIGLGVLLSAGGAAAQGKLVISNWDA